MSRSLKEAIYMLLSDFASQEARNPKTTALFMYHLFQLSMGNQSTSRLRDIEWNLLAND
jgi:hypothetical protein